LSANTYILKSFKFLSKRKHYLPSFLSSSLPPSFLVSFLPSEHYPTDIFIYFKISLLLFFNSLPLGLTFQFNNKYSYMPIIFNIVRVRSGWVFLISLLSMIFTVGFLFKDIFYAEVILHSYFSKCYF
jgi:hypothetical protein